MKEPKITVIGLYGFSIIMDVARFPVPGETIGSLAVITEPGGKGYNQAVAARRLGASVSFITAVGEDEFGAKCASDLESEGIDGKYIITLKHNRTACACVLNAEGQSEVIVHQGAISNITASDIEGFENVIKESDILLIQNEISEEALCAAVNIAYANDIKTIFNPAPARYVPLEIYKKVFCITPNETEAAIITGADPNQRLNIPKTLLELSELGCANVIITLGSEGASVYSNGNFTTISALDVNCVSATGAGDCFNAALAVRLGMGEDYENAARYAVNAAGISVTRYGVIQSMPYKNEIDSVPGVI